MTPAKITHVGAPEANPQAPDDSLGTTTAPRLGVLWNGKPLADLGLHEHVIDAEFVTTVGRTKATTRNPTGKPKVGGARLTFHMADKESSDALVRLLLADKQPIITLGYKPSSSINTCVTFLLATTLIRYASVFSLSPAISADFCFRTRPSGSAYSGLATTIAISTIWVGSVAWRKTPIVG